MNIPELSQSVPHEIDIADAYPKELIIDRDNQFSSVQFHFKNSQHTSFNIKYIKYKKTDTYLKKYKHLN